MYAKGHNGQIRIEGDWLVIERKGLGRLGHSKGDKRIALGQIVAVKMRPAGRFANGFIHFSTSGRDDFSGGLEDAARDDNSVIFLRKHQADFDELREHVEGYAASHLADTSSQGAQGTAEQLRQLAALRDEGLLTTEEFDAKKAELLSRM